MSYMYEGLLFVICLMSCVHMFICSIDLDLYAMLNLMYMWHEQCLMHTNNWIYIYDMNNLIYI